MLNSIDSAFADYELHFVTLMDELIVSQQELYSYVVDDGETAIETKADYLQLIKKAEFVKGTFILAINESKPKIDQILVKKIANNLRLKENKDLPRTNQIGEKTSDFFGEITYNFNDILTTKYNTSIKNDLENINYENLVTEISINNFVTTFDYFNENNTSDKISYLKNTTKYNLNDTSNVSFSTRKNKKTDLTEYYNLMYQYKNDCLAASIEYNKEYYNDRDISTEENIFFKLTIIPFGEASTPNLKN